MRKQILMSLVSLLFITGCGGPIPDLGINNGALTPCPNTPNCVNSQAVGKEQYIQPIRWTGSRQEAHTRLLQILESEKRTKILTSRENYIRSEFTSAFFRFVDDVEFYFPKELGDETIIHVRSASRVGRSDLGTNRKRIERIRNKLLK